MPLFLDCPQGHRLKVPRKRAGHRIRCPLCNQIVSVPPLAPPRPTASATKRTELPSDYPASIDRHVPPRPHDASESRVTEPPRDAVPVAENPIVTNPELIGPPLSAPETIWKSRQSGLPDASSVDEAEWKSHIPSPFQIENTAMALRDIEARAVAEMRFGAQLLGSLTIFLAILSALPSILEISSEPLLRLQDRWPYVVLLISVIQASVAVYSIRLIHWSTAWFVGLMTTAIAGAYAITLAITMFAAQDHAFLSHLGLTDDAYRRTAQPWCFCILCLMSVMALAYGRFSLRWFHRDHAMAIFH